MSCSYRRIKAIEASVADLQRTQVAIHSTLAELVQHLRSGSVPPPPSSSSYQTFRSSPAAYASSPSMSTPTTATPVMTDAGNPNADPNSASYSNQGALPPMISPAHSKASNRPTLGMPYRSPPTGGPSGQRHEASHLPPPNGQYPQNNMYQNTAQGTTLPPISSFSDVNSRQVAQSNVSSVRYQSGEAAPGSPRHGTKPSGNLHSASGYRSPKRKAISANSDNTSSNNTDDEEDDNGELPIRGLTAPWEVLRGLAEVAAERSARVSQQFRLS